MSFIRSVIFRWFPPVRGGDETQADESGGRRSPNVSSFQMADNTDAAIYKRLTAVAGGDVHQVLPAMDQISKGIDINDELLFDRIKWVAKLRPYEAGHLMKSLFDRAHIKTQLAIIGEFVSSPRMGDKHTVGDLFVKLLEKATEDERQNEIYPALLSIIEVNALSPAAVQGKRAFLSAMLRGWLSEA